MIECVYQPFQAVTLLDILDHDAAAFWKLSRLFAEAASRPDEEKVSGASSITMGQIRDHLKSLELVVSTDYFEQEMQNRDHPTISYKEFMARMSDIVASELKSKTFVYISSERASYFKRTVTENSAITLCFPSAERELLAAGRCYALGEPDASIFHSMRALEICLLSLCVRFSVETGQWETMINNIEAKIRQIGHSKQQGVKKSEQDIQDEHYFGQIATQLHFFKNGWRNYVMHIKEHYSDRDARQMWMCSRT
jgi:hypothetical protein